MVTSSNRNPTATSNGVPVTLRPRNVIPRDATRAQRVAAGKAVRAQVPLEGSCRVRAWFVPGSGRVCWCPVGRGCPSWCRYARSDARLSVHLLPWRRAPDGRRLATTPTTGLRVQLCGDAHLANFGAYASPERKLVFDINDFDETLPGPFEWDVKRLAASLVVAGRGNGFSSKDIRKTVLAAASGYRRAMREFAAAAVDERLVRPSRRRGSPRGFKSRLKADRYALTEALVAKARTRTASRP